jgi:putative endonuclease
MPNVDVGREGESVALEYLKTHCGLRFLEKNYRSGHFEIDLIMENSLSIRVVEVKTLNVADGFDPLVNISLKKRNNLYYAAQCYIAEHDIGNREVIFDVVTVIIDNGGVVNLEYYPDAFAPIMNCKPIL